MGEHEFELNIRLGNDAFAGDARPSAISQILRDVDGPIYDENGNKVGEWAYERDDDRDDDQPDCCGDPDLDENGCCQNCGEHAE
jgi:hypothetical protein